MSLAKTQRSPRVEALGVLCPPFLALFASWREYVLVAAEGRAGSFVPFVVQEEKCPQMAQINPARPPAAPSAGTKRF